MRTAARFVFAALFSVQILAANIPAAEWPEIHPDAYVSKAPGAPWAPPQGKPSAAASIPLPLTVNGSTKTLSLRDLIELALNTNPNLKSAWQMTRAQAATYGMAYSAYYPRIYYMSDGSFSRFLYNSIVPPGDDRLGSVNAGVGLHYILNDFGRRKAQVRVASEKLEAVNWAFDRKLQMVVFDVKSSFYAFAAARALLEATIVNKTLAQTDLAAVRARMMRGLATLPDFKFAEERESRAELEVDDAYAKVAVEQAALALALGLPADSNLKTEGLELQAVPQSLKMSVSDFIARAVQSRPDLASEGALLREREAAKALAKATWRPEIDVNGYYAETSWWLNLHHPTPVPAFGGSAVQTPGFYNTVQPFYSAGLSIRWDMFAGFKHLNDLRRAEAERQAQKETLQTRVLDTIADVWRSYFVFQAMQQKYRDARRLLDAAAESHEMHVESYRQGLDTIVDLLAAQRDLAHARYTMIGATADALTASAALDYAVGTSSSAPAESGTGR